MVLKDWKKLPESKETDMYETTYYNKDIAKIVLRIKQPNYLGLGPSLPYNVYVVVFKYNNKGIRAEDSSFNTRKEAVKYLKSYMRTH